MNFVTDSVKGAIGDLTSFAHNQFTKELWLRNLINLLVVGLIAVFVVFPLIRKGPGMSKIIPK